MHPLTLRSHWSAYHASANTLSLVGQLALLSLITLPLIGQFTMRALMNNAPLLVSSPYNVAPYWSAYYVWTLLIRAG